jgi:hypothetical protein
MVILKNYKIHQEFVLIKLRKIRKFALRIAAQQKLTVFVQLQTHTIIVVCKIVLCYHKQ